MELFDIEETVTKKRPVALSKEQEDVFWDKKAKEVLKNGWSMSAKEDVEYDLRRLDKYKDGFEKANELVGLQSRGSYIMNEAFVEWLDDLYSDYWDKLSELVKRWVSLVKPKPQWGVGTKLKYKEGQKISGLGGGAEVFYVNGHDEELAEYKVHPVPGIYINYVIRYELLEDKCEEAK